MALTPPRLDRLEVVSLLLWLFSIFVSGGDVRGTVFLDKSGGGSGRGGGDGVCFFWLVKTL